MSCADHYSGFGWIKVKRSIEASEASCEERLAALEAHHRKETDFLIREVRELAAEVDRLAAVSHQGPSTS
ncbi:hypothetical protein TA3x_003042 [Tundrisphaera sp. TA3]|uniref:hypothetical protein n=1 Tax=Tundrisphaera sp. TA3 TaxID=3435775 RepID=UPI003EB6975E